VPWSGVAQWETIDGGITRETVFESSKIVPRADAHLEVTTCAKTIKNDILCKSMWLQSLGQF
jgi:hypothetical protein